MPERIGFTGTAKCTIRRGFAKFPEACFAGCHPGPAGLSVVHMMSLALPVLVENGLEQHGPEVSLVEDGNNGVRYGAGQPATRIDEALAMITGDAARLRRMQSAAYNSYLDLITPSLATRLGRILLRDLPASASVELREAASAPTSPPPAQAMPGPAMDAAAE